MILGSASRGEFPVSLSGHFGFAPWLFYNRPPHSPEGFMYLKTVWAWHAWHQCSHENRYFHLDVIHWLLYYLLPQIECLSIFLRYWELGHAQETPSKNRLTVLKHVNSRNVSDEGISTLKYKIVSVEENASFTNYTIRLDPDLMGQSKKLWSWQQ